MNKELNEYYFDRDPYILNKILNFYQTGKLHIDHSECVHFIRDELEYWQINEFALEDCCKIIYFEKSDDIQENMQDEVEMRLKLNQKDDFGRRLFPSFRKKIWNLFNNPHSSKLAKV